MFHNFTKLIEHASKVFVSDKEINDKMIEVLG